MAIVCEKCGFNGETVSPSDAIVALRSFPRRYREAIDDVEDDSALRKRPAPEVWSVIEYVAHSADAVAFILDRMRRILLEDRPAVPPFGDPNERATIGRYNERALEDVLAAFEKRCVEAADLLDRARPDQWERVCVRPLAEATLLDTARYAVHEGSHHLRDVEKVLSAVR